MSGDIVMHCPRCHGTKVNVTDARSAFFHRDRLVLVEDIPALVCMICEEQFFDDRTTVALDLLRGAQFPDGQVVRKIVVPVFSLQVRREADA